MYFYRSAKICDGTVSGGAQKYNLQIYKKLANFVGEIMELCRVANVAALFRLLTKPLRNWI